MARIPLDFRVTCSTIAQKENVGLMILCRRVIVEKYRSNNGYDFSLLRDNNFKVLKSVKKGLLLVYELYMYTNICL